MLFRLFLQFQVAVFRLSRGRVMAAMRGMPILLLTTTGRRSGKSRTTPLMYQRRDEDYVVTASNNGRMSHPGWFYNLQAQPQAEIEVPGEKLFVQASVAAQAEREQLWMELVGRAPFFDGYQKSAGREIPMVVLTPR